MFLEPEAKHCYCRRRDSNDGPDGSDSLTQREDLRLPADDFKPGSHLEEGGLVKRRICPSDEIGSGGATFWTRTDSFIGAPNGESSVDPRNGSETLSLEHIGANGVSEYPHLQSVVPISRAGMGIVL